MTATMAIALTGVFTAVACSLLGPFLVVRRMALLSDAVSHAVLPGIFAAWFVSGTRGSVTSVLGAAVFAVVCVLAIERLADTGLVRSDAAIALVFPVLFSLGVLGIQRYAANIHLDLDSTIYGEIALVPFRTAEVPLLGELPRSMVLLAGVVVLDALLVAVAWKELKVTSFDPAFAHAAGIDPRHMSRLLLLAVAVTAVLAFDAVGAILVVTLFIVPAVTALLVTARLGPMLVVSVAAGAVSALLGYRGAIALDASIAGMMGLATTALFAVALLARVGMGAWQGWRLRRTVAGDASGTPAH